MQTLTQRVIDYYKAGRTNAEACEVFGFSANCAASYRRKYHQVTGSELKHHSGKATMIHRLLLGKTGLSIYETNGGLGETGEPGHCYKAYKEHGEVTSRSKADGDVVDVTYKEIASGRTYHVVDCDGYGDPTQLLQIGVTRLLKPGGLLFTTWPPLNWYKRFSVVKINAILQRGEPAMDVDDCVKRQCLCHKLSATKLSVEVYGNTIRCVHRIAALKWNNLGNNAEPIAQAFRLCGPRVSWKDIA